MQERTMRAWANAHLKKGNHALLNDLFTDFRDSTRLMNLLDVVANAKLPRESGSSRSSAITNVNTALQYLSEHGLDTSGIDAEEVADGNNNHILELLWILVQLQHTFAQTNQQFSELQSKSATEVLFKWCKHTLSSYSDIQFEGFSNTWRDGRAFAALISKHRPDILDYEYVRNMSTAIERLDYTYNKIKSKLGVEPVLSMKDICSEPNIDARTVQVFLLQLFYALPVTPHSLTGDTNTAFSESQPSSRTQSQTDLTSSQENLADIPRRRGRKATETLKEYQSSLEECLVWLLEADEKLKEMAPVSESDVETVKRQFKEHEEYMLRLRESQESVGKVLRRGQALVKSGRLNTESTNTVVKQVTVVNEKWEALRAAAMTRQAVLHDRLNVLQQRELDNVRQWLNNMEATIAEAAPLATEPDELEEQARAHKLLQDEIETEQNAVFALSAFVAVVDEAQGGYEQLESALADIGNRWMKVCKWAEKRAMRLDGIADAIRIHSMHESA